jgi:hypothetical protein
MNMSGMQRPAIIRAYPPLPPHETNGVGRQIRDLVLLGIKKSLPHSSRVFFVVLSEGLKSKLHFDF